MAHASAFVIARELDFLSHKASFINATLRQTSLRGSVLVQDTANTSLRELELATNKLDAGCF